MKEPIVLFGVCAIIVFGLVSCSDIEKQPNQHEIVTKKVEEYAKSKMNDPESFEFVSLLLIDSVLYSDNIKLRKDYYRSEVEINQSELKFQERYKIEFPSIYDEKLVEQLAASIEKDERILVKIDSIVTQLGERTKEVASYTYSFSFRGNNAFGAKVLNEYVVQTNPSPSFEIINMTDEQRKIINNPNDFPGYRQMISKNL